MSQPLIPREAMTLPPGFESSIYQPPRLRAVARYAASAEGRAPESVEIEINDPITDDIVRSVVATLVAGTNVTNVIVQRQQPQPPVPFGHDAVAGHRQGGGY